MKAPLFDLPLWHVLSLWPGKRSRGSGLYSSKMPFPLQDRVTLARNTWDENPATRVRTFGHADPGGELPVKTLNGLEALVAEQQSRRTDSLRYSVTQF